MSVEIKVPVLPESVADATIAAWHKKVGESVVEGENLVDLETDKVVLEVPAPADGVLEAIHVNEGGVVKANELLGSLGDPVAIEAAPTQASELEKAPGTLVKSAPAPVAQVVEAEPVDNANSNATPSARRLMAEHGIDAANITLAGGHITKQDVNAYLNGGQAMPAMVSQRTEERVAMSRLRARIAERLVNVQQETAMLTTFNEVDMKPVMEIRAKYKEAFEKRHGVRLGFMSFFTKACAEALRRFPNVNASIDGKDIVYHDYQDIGIAVSTEKGLVVPVLRDAQLMNFAQVEQNIRGLAGKARDGKLSLEEMTGGTFTITNGGTFGSLMSTPIINAPQSAILGMHAIKERPVVVDGEMVIRPMMYLALSYDHRIIDGKDSVQFLVTVKELLEDPAKLLLDI